MSIREMKKKLKNELPVGTFVNNDVYVCLQEAVDKYLIDLSKIIALMFSDSEDRILKKQHVTEAVVLLGTERYYSNSISKRIERLGEIK